MKSTNLNLRATGISVFESDFPISSAVQKEFLNYHPKRSIRSLSSENLTSLVEKLFNPDITLGKKKEFLFQLGHGSSKEHYDLIKKYMDDPKSKLKEWALLCLAEFQFNFENKLYPQGRDMVISGLGGRGNRLRCYFILSSTNDLPINSRQQSILKDRLNVLCAAYRGKIETMEFYRSYVLIKILVPLNIAIGEVIDKGIEIVNQKESFLRVHYFCTNVKRPDPREIQEYLQTARKDCP